MSFFDSFKKKSTSPATATPPAPAVLKVADFLTPARICFLPDGQTKSQILGTLIAALKLKDSATALNAILAREGSGGTVIAPGLALPHARIPGLTSIEAVIGLTPAGVSDGVSPDPIKVFVLFLAPSDNMRQHLAFLASVSALFQTPDLIPSLVALSEPENVLMQIRQAEAGLNA